jgi:Tol biopolymer transport system component
MRCGIPVLIGAFLVATELVGPVAASQGEIDDEPAGVRNLEVAPALHPVFERLRESSPTFRRQCARIAASKHLRVKVLPDDQPRRPSIDARSAFTFEGGALTSADVYVDPSPDAAWLVAHEFEHILEQLDGVNLGEQADSEAVWRNGENSFETRRAIEAGQRVFRELLEDRRQEVGVRRPGAGDTGHEAGGGRQQAEDRRQELEGGRQDVGGRRQEPAGGMLTISQADADGTPLSGRTARVAAGGRHIVFISRAPLVAADRNAFSDVYVLDVETGRYSLESIGWPATHADGDSSSADISADGRYVTFASEAGNLLSTPLPPGTPRVFLRDRHEGITRLLSTTISGEPASGPSRNPAISADGRVVVFESAALDVFATRGGGLGPSGIYAIDRSSGARARVDVGHGTASPAGPSVSPAISADGRYVAFATRADLTCRAPSACAVDVRDRNGVNDIYLRDMQSNTIRRISRGHAGGDPDGASYDPAISGDGRFIAFVSEASNLTRGPKPRAAQVFVHDQTTGITTLVSRTPDGGPSNARSLRPAISHDGSTIAFQSLACDLLCTAKCAGGERDINLLWDVFVHDRSTRHTTRISTDGGEEWMENSRAPALDGSGRMVSFSSRHPIGRDDRDLDEDLFVKSR